jgi:hypothetical protein
MLASGTKALIDRGNAAGLSALDLATARVQIADDRPGILIRRHNLDLHHRLKQFWASLLDGFAERGTPCDFKGKNRGVHIVVGAVGQRRLDVEHREAGNRAR